jgi:mRNA interferase RelE/StbE
VAYWKIEFEDQAAKQFLKLDKQSQKQLRTYLNTKILKLEHPKLSGKALGSNKKGLWRYRMDKFRIICKLEEETLVILVVKIAKRDVVYND